MSNCATCSWSTNIQLSNIKYFDFTAVENKTFLRKKAWFSAANDPHFANLTMMLNSPLAVAKKIWWRWQESNLRPPECKSGALPTELHPQKNGCGDRIWTCDLWVMSPTSYRTAPPRDKPLMVGLGRLELPTSRLSGVRSNQLSYRPSFKRTSW